MAVEVESDGVLWRQNRMKCLTTKQPICSSHQVFLPHQLHAALIRHHCQLSCSCINFRSAKHWPMNVINNSTSLDASWHFCKYDIAVLHMLHVPMYLQTLSENYVHTITCRSVPQCLCRHCLLDNVGTVANYLLYVKFCMPKLLQCKHTWTTSQLGQQNAENILPCSALER